MHQHGLEIIPAFWVARFLFIMVDPALWLAQALMDGFVAKRIAHVVAYATHQTHEVRAVFYTIGSLSVIYMAPQFFRLQSHRSEQKGGACAFQHS